MKLKELNAKIIITLNKSDLVQLLNRLSLGDMAKLVKDDRHSFFRVLNFLELMCNEQVAAEFDLEFFKWKLGEIYQNYEAFYRAELEFFAKDITFASAESSLKNLTKFLLNEITNE